MVVCHSSVLTTQAFSLFEVRLQESVYAPPGILESRRSFDYH
jgi:hypothetical protein